MFEEELVADNFAGGGGASTGIEMAGFEVDIAVNHDQIALGIHEANHPKTIHHCENVWNVDPIQATKGRPVGLAWFSPDCFPGGTMILTSSGYRPIETVGIGDLVLTHRGRWMPVTATMKTKKRLIEIQCHGHPGIRVSEEHPFLVRTMNRKWQTSPRGYVRQFHDVEWKPAKNITNRADFVATPLSVPSIPIPAMKRTHGLMTTLPIDERLMWLAGRYVGDGWTRLTETRGELVIICGRHEADDVAGLLNAWPRTGFRVLDGELAWGRRDLRTAVQFSTNSRSLVEWLRENFGHGAKNKKFPGWAFGMDCHLRMALLDGYLSADGWKGKDRGEKEIIEATTVSPALAWSVKTLATTLGHACAVYYNQNQSTTIEGRTVKSNPVWRIRWRSELVPDHLQTFCDELHRWSPVRKCSSLEDVVDIFNLSVEEDESYVADSLVVHNCTHFSRAKGGKPVKKKIRSLAWVVIRWAKTVHPRLIVLENVPEFAEWGPLTSDNRPCPLRKGKTFRAWMAQLRNLGYEIEYKILCAADYGAPTIRKRLFLIARCDGQPIVWPEQTHADPKVLTKMGRIFKSNLKPWRTAAECIDWSIPCPSIFERKKPLAEATLRRIAKGIMRYVINTSDPFIVNLAHGEESPNGVKRWGTGHRDINSPLPTITGTGDHAVVTPYLTKYHGESAGSGIGDPFPTVTANSFHKRPGGNIPIALVAPVVVKNNFGTKPCQGVTDPLHTVTTQGNKHALVSAFLAKHYGDSGQRPGSEMGEPLGTVTSVDHHSLVTAHIQRDFKSSVGHSLDDPSGTITAGGGGKAALVTSNLVKLRGTCKDGQPVDEPMPTVTAGGNHVAEVRAFLLKYYGTDQDPQLREPLHTVTTKDRFGLVTVHGVDYQIVDIGMRMLTPRELFRAQGFPDSYLIDRLPDGKKIGKSDQIRLCGNSVCPPVAAAIVQANYLNIDAEGEEVG